MRFDFATAARVLFASGAVSELPTITREFGTRPLAVTGANPERHRELLNRVGGTNFTIAAEPTVDEVRAGSRIARENNCDVVIGIGGGSAIDAAKAIAILAANSGEPLDYLEVVGKGRAFENAGLPFIAVPTTAGAGAEVTRNAVLSSHEHGLKASLRSAWMLAKVAVVDPDLTLKLPPAVTAYTGLDALTQVIEPYVSSRANALTDLFCVEGMRLARIALGRAFSNGSDATARTEMSFTSLLGGLSLANAGLGVVHGFASPLGGVLKAHHGEICAAVLPHGVAANIRVLPSGKRSKFDEAGRILTASPNASAADLVTWLNDIVHRLGIRSLAQLGLQREQIPDLVTKAAAASSMKANPVTLNSEQLTEIATAAWEGCPAAI